MHAKPSDKYLLFVEWSDEDGLFIGYCPDLFFGGVCHDETRIAAYAKLVEIVEYDVAHRLEIGEKLSPPSREQIPKIRVGFKSGVVRRSRFRETALMLLTHDEITRLSPDERLTLIAQLWDSLDDHQVQLTPTQKAELDRRLATLDHDRAESVTLETLKTELEQREQVV
jgi:putative addiction module component (TIGR02574 family)